VPRFDGSDLTTVRFLCLDYIIVHLNARRFTLGTQTEDSRSVPPGEKEGKAVQDPITSLPARALGAGAYKPSGSVRRPAARAARTLPCYTHPRLCGMRRSRPCSTDQPRRRNMHPTRALRLAARTTVPLRTAFSARTRSLSAGSTPPHAERFFIDLATPSPFGLGVHATTGAALSRPHTTEGGAPGSHLLAPLHESTVVHAPLTSRRTKETST
jgi:hypothetical protein